MGKVQAVMVALYATTDDLRRVKRVAKRFEKLNKIPVRIIVNQDLGGIYLSYPTFGRYYAWRIVPKDTEKLIYLDNDILPVCPLPELPDVDFAAVPDIDTINNDMAKHWPLFRAEGAQYFNSGFFIAGRKTEQLFDNVLARQTHANERKWPWFRDQTLLNIETQMAVQHGDLTFKALSKQWNHLALMDFETVKNPYMLHLTGAHEALKLRLVDYLLDLIS